MSKYDKIKFLLIPVIIVVAFILVVVILNYATKTATVIIPATVKIKDIPVVKPEIKPNPVPAIKPDKTPKPPCCGSVKVIAFTAPWCGPCQQAKPKLAEAQKKGLDVQIVNIDSEPTLAHQYAITSVPTFIITKDGKSQQTHDVNAVVALIQ